MLNRRGFLGALVAIPLAIQARTIGFGYVDASMAYERGWLPAKVWLDGVDVSDDCRAMNDRAGYVVLFKRNSQGKHYVDRMTGDSVTETRFGRVVYQPKGTV